MTNKYKNDPIQEALCEFRFAPSVPWNLTVPGRLHAKLSKEYNGEPREMNRLETTINAAKVDANIALLQTLDRVQLPDLENTKILAVGPHVLSVHSLAPYDGWERFRPRI